MSNVIRVVAAAVVAFSLAAPATPSLAADEPTALGATTRLHTTTSTQVAVVLTRPVAVSLASDQNPNVTLNTEGDFAAVALVEESRANAATMFASWSSERIRCGGNCPLPTTPYTVQVVNGQAAAPTVLPAGRYTLFLVSDGASTTVDLTFRELAGEVDLRSGPPARAVLEMPQARMSPIAGALTYSAGTTHVLPEHGLVFTQLTAVGDRLAGPGEAGTCLYVGDEKAGDYLPGCPTADIVGTSRSIGGGTAYTTKSFGLTIGLAPGPYGLGGYVARAADIKYANLVTFSLAT